MGLLDRGGYIELVGVEKSYRVDAVVTPVLRSVTTSFAKGSFTAIVGPSGCGKSTLLTLLGALDRPDGGTITVAGIELAGADRATLGDYRRSHVGFVFQAYNLLRSLTALENVEAALAFAGLDSDARRARAMESLAQVGLDGEAKKFPSQMSGGQQQRVAIARAIVRRPALLLADEPTGNLDREAAANVADMLRALQRELALTTILVTHDTTLAAGADRTVRMRDGRIDGDG